MMKSLKKTAFLKINLNKKKNHKKNLRIQYSENKFLIKKMRMKNQRLSREENKKLQLFLTSHNHLNFQNSQYQKKNHQKVQNK